MIYAAKIGKMFPDASNTIIPSELWLPADIVSAYRVSNGTVTEIMDEEIHEIKAEMIDEISQTINEQYEKLADIEYA